MILLESTLSWRNPNHIETNPSICSANQWTGFCIIWISVMKELNILLLLFYRRVMSSVKFLEARECRCDARFFKKKKMREKGSETKVSFMGKKWINWEIENFIVIWKINVPGMLICSKFSECTSWCERFQFIRVDELLVLPHLIWRTS